MVTGAARGIGRACAERLADDGHPVVIVDRDPTGSGTAATIRDRTGRTCEFVECDVTDPDQVAAMSGDVSRRHGPVRHLVNVVGGARRMPTLDMSVDIWRQELEFNLTSAFVVTRHLAPAMLSSDRGGSVVLMSSGWAFRPAPERAAYAAAKAGLVAFARSLAAELGQRGVRVNVVAPGPIATARMEAMTEQDRFARSEHERVPLGRLGTPEDVAGAVAFLVSPAAAYVTGQVVHVNGGLYMA